jgi:poly [ADP-ribose] polymerase
LNQSSFTKPRTNGAIDTLSFLTQKKYTWLEMDYEGDKSSKKEQIEKNEIESISKHQPQQSKLDNHLAQFISLICNVSMMKHQMM